MDSAISTKKSEVKQQTNHDAEGALHAFMKDAQDAGSRRSSKVESAPGDVAAVNTHAKSPEHEPKHLDFAAHDIYDTAKKTSGVKGDETPKRFADSAGSQKPQSDLHENPSPQATPKAEIASLEAQKSFDAGTKLIAQESKRFSLSGIMLAETN